ncbi:MULTISPECIES: HPr(Ser) kinase/phosphatase [unclassified Mycoplasma]|uniref:HPr(Ser) kinase/phosphatase n=1 Tax=unclassified Mycoplasma TaxID=2683645 RepID=UPI000FDF111C
MTANKKPLTSREVIETFDLELINQKADLDLDRIVRGAAINRAGLELMGFANAHQEAHIIGWGTKENDWLKKIGPQKAVQALGNVLSTQTPLVILSSGVKGQSLRWIIEQSNRFKIPVSQVKHHLSGVISTIGLYLATYFAPSQSVHGSLMIVNGVGVLITGKSGIGKSEAVLELIQNGHLFISDDTVIVKRIGRQIIGESAPITSGILEARGIGLVDIGHVYGFKVVKESTTIDFVVELVVPDSLQKFDRLGTQNLRYEVLQTTLPKVKIPIYQGRSSATLIEAAANVYLAKKDGINPLETITKRQKGEH